MTERLENEGHHFSFFQAIRRIHALDPQAPRMGFQGPVERERIRLRPALSLSFPTADIAAVRQTEMADGGLRWHLDVNFMGLYGPSSPLPTFYTEDLLRDEYQGEDISLVRGFLDLFHHRLLALLYRCWEKYRHTVQYDPAGRDFYSTRLLRLLGAHLPWLPENQQLAAGSVLAYAGLLTQRPRGAASLRAMLAAHFPQGEVALLQCVAGFKTIPAAQQNRLGQANSRLGADLCLGRDVPDRAGNFGIRVGPLGFDDYIEFMPDRAEMAQLNELVDLFNSDGLDYEVTVVLRGDQTPALQLGNPVHRLGYSSWLGENRLGDRTVTFRFEGWRHGRG
ncbi:MAG: type VI secretion system baseplate subunit TssG [Planctomycetes bacterium]|nr:type VI secretion system baseplate subunit TssG [Planctomycetota bacterium]MCL4729878.1 type VI secretion system baseplate subunit TssG [Planctomycetota bacterium]